MMNSKEITGAITGNVLSLFGLSVSVTELEAIVGIICSVLGIIVTIISALIIPLIRKIKSAKADGKVTADEAADIAGTIKDGIEQTVDKIEDTVNKVKDMQEDKEDNGKHD